MEKNKELQSPEIELQIERFQTEVDVHRNVYIELKKQLEIAKIEEIKETETLDVLQSAVIPIYKTKPKRRVIVIFSLFLGFTSSILFILIQKLWIKMNK